MSSRKRKSVPINAVRQANRPPTAPSGGTMGLKKLSKEQKVVWDRLVKPDRKIQVTRFAHEETLEKLGLMSSVERLLAKVGLGGFLGKSAVTYERYTLEFLATLSRGEDGEGKFIKFHLNDKEYELSYEEVFEAFEWTYRTNSDFYKQGIFNEALFFSHITNGLVWHGKRKSSSIPHPALRYVHRLLSMTIFCHGEPSNLSRADLRYLWAMSPEGVGCPDWVDIFIGNCIDIAKNDKGKISMGGMVTLLARYLNVSVPVEDKRVIFTHLGHLNADYYTIELLEKCGMLWTSPHKGDRHVWLYGANNIKYMTLPQPSKTDLTNATTSAQLYVPSDDEYKWSVVEYLGKENEDEIRATAVHHSADDETEHAPSTIDMSLFEERFDEVKLRLNSMQLQIDGLEDTVDSMSSILTAMNKFHVANHPAYVDPSAEIEANKQQRVTKRAERRNVRSRGRGEPSSSQQ